MDELNDGSSSKDLFILLQLLHDIGGCSYNLLDYKVHK